jgi:hypothetical protein
MQLPLRARLSAASDAVALRAGRLLAREITCDCTARCQTDRMARLLHLVCVRLDRAVANSALIDMLEGYQVENVVTTSSDHMAISINYPNGP